MPSVYIPTSTELAYRIRTTLSDEDFVFDFVFNDREGFWYFDLLDANAAPIICGVKVVVGFPLLLDVVDARRPVGEIVALDTTGKDLEAGQNDLAPPTPRVRLVYVGG